jgi:hypothetical protein
VSTRKKNTPSLSGIWHVLLNDNTRNLYAMELLLANIPAELKLKNQWLCHDKDKKPISATSGISIEWQYNLTSFDRAINYAEQHGLRLGFAFSGQTEYSGIDLDGCVNPRTGAIEPWAMSIIDAVQSYVELSLSYTGLKLFCRGTYAGNLPTLIYGPQIHGDHQQQAEFKTSAGYFAVTGLPHNQLPQRDIANVDLTLIYRCLNPNWQPIEDASNHKPPTTGL